MELSQLIRYSPERSSLFASLQHQLSPNAHSLKPLCPTRWTVRTGAISSVLSNYSVLCEALEQINAETHDDYGRKAGGFFAQMERFSTFFGLEFSHLIFSGTEQLFLSLQGKNTTVQEAVSAGNLAIKFLENLRSDVMFDQFYTRTVEKSKDLTAEPVLPRVRRPPRKPGDSTASVHLFPDPASVFRKQYFEVLDLFINKLKHRFQQKRGLPTVSAIERVLLNASNGTPISDSEELSGEFLLYDKDINLPRLKIQLQMLPDLIRARNAMPSSSHVPIKAVTNLRTLCDIMNELSVSKEIIRILKIFYTIPVTTATAERTFSALRRLKTYLRSTMSQPRLNHTMMCYVHKERTDQIVIEDVAKCFIMENERRRRYFGDM